MVNYGFMFCILIADIYFLNLVLENSYYLVNFGENFEKIIAVLDLSIAFVYKPWAWATVCSEQWKKCFS